MAKIQIGKSNVKLSLAQQVENNGFGFGRNAAGELALTVKFPGCDSVELTADGVESLNRRLSADVAKGDSPAAVFNRTARDFADGGMSAQFSDAKRSRTVTFTADDREDVAALLGGMLDNWDSYAKQLADAEAAANEEGTSAE